MPLEQYSCILWVHCDKTTMQYGCSMIHPVKSWIFFNTTHRLLVVKNGPFFIHLIWQSKPASLDQLCATGPFSTA